MVDRDFITVPRVMDDGEMHCRHADIVMVAANANEGGIVEGTSAVYFREGLAIAVNMSPEDVMGLIRSKEITQ